MRPHASQRLLFATCGVLAGAMACGHDWSSGEVDAEVGLDVADDGTTDDAAIDFPPEADGTDQDEGAEDGPGDEGSADEADEAGPPCTSVIGHDEDADGVDDACDNCPSWANALQEDTDADGLGDACEVSEAPDLLSAVEVFDPFWASPTLPPPGVWHDMSGTWEAGTDAVVGTSAPYGANRWLEFTASSPYSVETRFRFADDTHPTDASYACLLFGFQLDVVDPAQSPWLECCFNYLDRMLSLWRFRGGTGTIMMITSSADVLESAEVLPSALRRLRVVWDGVRVDCTFENEVDASGLVQWTPASAEVSALTGAGGLRTYNSSVAFESFVLYR